MKYDPLNRDALLFHFSEINGEVRSILQDIRDGDIEDDIGDHALAHRFNHILSHLCAAWHCRHMSPEEFEAITERDDLFNWTMKSIPNWNNEFKMVEMDASFPSEK